MKLTECLPCVRVHQSIPVSKSSVLLIIQIWWSGLSIRHASESVSLEASSTDMLWYVYRPFYLTELLIGDGVRGPKKKDLVVMVKPQAGMVFRGEHSRDRCDSKYWSQCFQYFGFMSYLYILDTLVCLEYVAEYGPWVHIHWSVMFSQAFLTSLLTRKSLTFYFDLTFLWEIVTNLRL